MVGHQNLCVSTNLGTLLIHRGAGPEREGDKKKKKRKKIRYIRTCNSVRYNDCSQARHQKTTKATRRRTSGSLRQVFTHPYFKTFPALTTYFVPYCPMQCDLSCLNHIELSASHPPGEPFKFPHGNGTAETSWLNC
jgi:hypothetical protein